MSLGEMPNIILAAVGILVAISSTLATASPTGPQSSNATTSVNQTFLTDSPLQTSTEALLSGKGITVPTLLAETTAFDIDRVTKRVDTTPVGVASLDEEVKGLASQGVDTDTLEADKATLQEDVESTTLQEDVESTTLQEEQEVDTATLQEEEVNTVMLQEEQEVDKVILQEMDTPTLQEKEVDTPLLQEETDTTTPQEVDTTMPQEEVDTVKGFSGEDVKLAPLKDEVSTASQEVNSSHPAISDPNTQASEEEEEESLQGVDTGIAKAQTTKKPEGSAVKSLGKMDKVLTRPDQLVKCFCGGQEVLMSSGCQVFQRGTVIHLQEQPKITRLKEVAELDVVVHDLQCDVEADHREMKFSKGQFYLRQRGDIVLREGVGHLKGLRINNYCVSHLLDEDGDLTWMMKACIPPPSVPTCCLPGHALKGGKCRPARRPDLLTPPLSAEPFEESIEWPVIKNHHSPITCTDDPMKTLDIPTKKSHLTALPTGIVHTWLPVDDVQKRIFTFPPNFCVDAQQNLDGSVKYFAILCYSDPEERHHQVCDGNTCVRKCCDFGKLMDTSLYRCIPSANAAFDPPIVPFLTDYETVTGTPLCKLFKDVEGDIYINENGELLYEDRTFPPTDYCVDKFSDNRGKTENSGLACYLAQPTWFRVREVLFPIAQAISIIFLFLTVLCYYSVPVLLRNGGWYQLCHVLSLMVAYSTTFVQMQFNRYFSEYSCIALGLVLQFSFLAAFFWLSVLCFEAWRKIRSLNKLMPCATMPVWVYPLYAFGMPSIIGCITILMQFLAPDNVKGVIKPYLGITRCWFLGDIQLLLYFYGPIAFLFICNAAFISHTFWNYKGIEASKNILKNSNADQPPNSRNPVSRTMLEQKNRIRDYSADFKHQFYLLVLIAGSWVAEVLSWKIPPPEVWAPTSVINSLQGFFIFVIFMSNWNKRKHIKERFPKIFEAIDHLKSELETSKLFFLCRHTKKSLSHSVDRVTSFFAYLLTFPQRLSPSSSSFHILPNDKVRKPSTASESKDGIITLSHSQLDLSHNKVESTFV